MFSINSKYCSGTYLQKRKQNTIPGINDIPITMDAIFPSFVLTDDQDLELFCKEFSCDTLFVIDALFFKYSYFKVCTDNASFTCKSFLDLLRNVNENTDNLLLYVMFIKTFVKNGIVANCLSTLSIDRFISLRLCNV